MNCTTMHGSTSIKLCTFYSCRILYTWRVESSLTPTWELQISQLYTWLTLTN